MLWILVFPKTGSKVTCRAFKKKKKKKADFWASAVGVDKVLESVAKISNQETNLDLNHCLGI